MLERYKKADIDRSIQMFVHMHTHKSFSNKMMMRKHMRNIPEED